MLLVPDEIRNRLLDEQARQPLPAAAVIRLLTHAGVKLTRQRIALGRLLFGPPSQHVTVETLHRNAAAAGTPLSLATIYTALNQFCEAGLLRRVRTNGERIHFDTNTADHHHFLVEAEGRLIDIPAGEVRFSKLPEPPSGHAVARIDVVIRLRPRADTPA